MDGAIVEALRARRQVILDNIRDNDEAGVNYQKEIELNEKHRCQLQGMIEEAISNNGNKTYLRILSQYRLLGMANTELQFEMAMRDQIINNQREAQRNLWNLLTGLGLDEKCLLELAAKRGITSEDCIMMPHLGLLDMKQSPHIAYGKYAPVPYSPCVGRPFPRPCISQHHQNFDSRSLSKGPWDLVHNFCRKEHQNSYYMSHDQPHSACQRFRSSSDHCAGSRSDLWQGTRGKHLRGFDSSCPEMRTWTSPFSDNCSSISSLSADFSQQHKDAWTNSYYMSGWLAANTNACTKEQ